jgi:hypothetical protein
MHPTKIKKAITSFKENIHLKMTRKGPKHVVSEWKEIITKNSVAIDGHYNKVLVMNTTRCNLQK